MECTEVSKENVQPSAENHVTLSSPENHVLLPKNHVLLQAAENQVSCDDANTEKNDLVEPKSGGGYNAPDGGWGWVVVFGSFMIHVIADGIAYSFGVYVEEFRTYFDCSSGDVGMLGSLMLGVTWGTGPIASILTNIYGCRTITIAGTIIAAFGFIISIFAPNIIFMYFSFGIIAGFGLGMAYLPAIVAVSFYFEKRRSLATGLAVCGSGFGTFIFAPLTDILIEHFCWKGTILIETALLLNCIICGAVFRPIDMSGKPKDADAGTDSPGTATANNTALEENDVSKVVFVEKSRLASSLISIPQEKSNHRRRTFSETDKSANQNTELLRPASRKDIYYPANLEHIPLYRSNPDEYKQSMTMLQPPLPPKTDDKDEKKEVCLWQLVGCWNTVIFELRQSMDVTLLCNFVFNLFAVSNLLTSIGYCVPYVFLPDRAVDMKIADKWKSSFLISLIGISNTVGRIVFGWIADFKFVNRLMLYNTVLVLCGVASVASSLCYTYELMSLYSVCFGLLIGVYTCLTPIVLVDLLGLDKLSNSFGLVLLFQGIGAVIGPPFAGSIKDHTGNYDYSFYMMGICIFVSGAMLYPIPCIRRWSKSRTTDKEIALGMAPTRDVQLTDEEQALQQSASESAL